MKQIMIGVLVVFLLAACGSGASASVEGQWRLVSYNQTPALPDVETSIEFMDGQMSGNMGCNGFGGEYTMNGDTITFGPVMMTEMFCESVDAQESAVIAVLQGDAGFMVDGNNLTLTSPDGSSSIVLERK